MKSVTKYKPNPRQRNGSARRKLVARVKAASDTCALCGGTVDKSLHYQNKWAGVVDEIIPVSKGGSPYDISNCQLAHRYCNRLKSDKVFIPQYNNSASTSKIRTSQKW